MNLGEYDTLAWISGWLPRMSVLTMDLAPALREPGIEVLARQRAREPVPEADFLPCHLRRENGQVRCRKAARGERQELAGAVSSDGALTCDAAQGLRCRPKTCVQ